MRKYKIMIVENDEDEQVFMKESFLSNNLFELLGLVKNGNELFDWLQQHTSTLPDIILSDLNMPGKNGYDIITEIRSTPAYSHIPVIITSTSSTKAFIDKCMAFGAAEYLEKPETFIGYGAFAKKLHQVIDEKELVK